MSSFDALLGDLALNCMRCGLCLAVCPTYQEAGIEPVSPRGRIALAQAIAQSKLPSGKTLSRYLYSCLNCLACQDVCPSGVRIDELVLLARAGIQVHHPSRIARAVLDHILPFPKRAQFSLLPLRLYQRSGLKELMRRSGALHTIPQRLSSLDYLLAELPPRPLQDDLPEVIPAKGQAKLRVGFFLGCAHNLLLTSIGRATVAVLVENSCEVVIPRGLKCCGMPHQVYGGREQGRELARHNIDVFAAAGVGAIITDCATCGSCARRYQALLEDDPKYADPARDFSQKIQDISKFLTQTISGKHLGRGKRVTYHEPCHLVRGQRIAEEPRHLLSLILGLELVEMKEADWCCGGGGSYSLTNFDLSMGILDRKMANIAATGAELVATGCPGCILQLRLGVKRAGLKAEVVHPVELLAEAYSKLWGRCSE